MEDAETPERAPAPHGGQTGPEALAVHEEWVLANPLRERAVLLDAQGRVITRKEGERDAVLWTEAAALPLIGRVDLIVHNHPRGTSVGEDDADLVLFLNAREVRAVSPTRRYRLRRLHGFWPPVSEFKGAIAEERDRLVEELIQKREEGSIDDGEIERTFYDRLWPRLVRRYADGVSYEVEGRE